MYRSRNFDWSLEQTVRLRSHIITAAVANFQPDLFIVDKVPRGIGNELEPILKLLKESGETRCVLGLRDVLDEPHVVAREWAQEANGEAIECYFDELWIYGDRAIYDSIHEYRFEAAIAQRCRYTGYLNQSLRLEHHDRQPQRTESLSTDPALLALCVVGGGQDGFELAAAFVSAGVPVGWRGVVITGPHMPHEQRRRLANLIPSDSEIEIIDRLVETEVYLKSAARVVTMGGYNSIMSVLSYCKPSMVVPRIAPRREQWIRAKRLEDAGWLTLVLPEQLSPSIIRQWLETPLVPTPAPGCVDLGGLQQITERVLSLNPTCCTPI